MAVVPAGGDVSKDLLAVAVTAEADDYEQEVTAKAITTNEEVTVEAATTNQEGSAAADLKAGAGQEGRQLAGDGAVLFLVRFGQLVP